MKQVWPASLTEDIAALHHERRDLRVVSSDVLKLPSAATGLSGRDLAFVTWNLTATRRCRHRRSPLNIVPRSNPRRASLKLILVLNTPNP